MNSMNRWNERNANPKIVLINPSTSRWKLYYWYFLFGSKEAPLGLLYIASYLESNNYSVEILDGDKIGERNLFRKIKEINPDIIGITSTTFSFNKVRKIVKAIRGIRNNSLIILGGSHSSALPNYSLELIPELDGCVVGEGEETMLEIVSGFDVKQIKGLVWKNEEEIIITNSNRASEINLDKYKINFNLLKEFPKKYSPSFQSRKRNSTALVVSRGCPYSCSFCASQVIHGKNLRKHSVNYVFELMKSFFRNYAVTNFYFHDDYFTLDISWLKSFCEMLIESNCRFTWSCATRIELLTDEVLMLMKKSGCIQIGIGVESGSDEVLSFLNKKIYSQRMLETIRKINTIGIYVKGYFIIGTPQEKISELISSIKMIFKVSFQHVQILYFTPLPGSKSFIDSPIAPDKWNKLNLLYPVYDSIFRRLFLRIVEFIFYMLAYLRSLTA